MSRQQRIKIAYIMSRFPHLPETFILREMNEMEAQGWEVALYPLLRQRQKIVHAEAERWLARVHSLSLGAPRLLLANGRAGLRGRRRLVSLWGRMLSENSRSPGFLLRALYIFPKAVYAAEQMKAEGIAYIHAHYGTHPALMAWLIHHLTGIPYGVVTHAHDIYVNQTMLRTKLRDARLVVTISEFNRAYLKVVGGEGIEEKTHVIHCGIKPERYARPAEVRQSEQLEIVNVGSLQPYKGQRHLVEACARLREQGIPFRCRIVGEGEERVQLEKAIAARGLTGTVTLLGAKTEAEVAELLGEANCYVQPSVVTRTGKMEGIPVALMEAMAAGLPVVASELSGIPELVRPGETGYLVPPAEPGALAECLAHIYANPCEAASRAQAGRVLVEREFNLRRNVRQLSALISSVVCEQQPAKILKAIAGT